MQARVVAIDWSGRGGADQSRFIWLCEIAAGEVVRLECGRTRGEVVTHLIDLVRGDSDVGVGLDFSFSTPAWFLHERGLATAPALWAVLAEECLTPRMREIGLRSWLLDPETPFWRAARPEGLTPARAFRQTELDHAAPGTRPKSVFQLVGGGQVGASSLTGMQALHELAGAGFSVWPFVPATPPYIVEIYPRLLSGPVVKSDPSARAAHLSRFSLADEHRAAAVASEDAFDALVAALALARSSSAPEPVAEPSPYALEGCIWALGP